MIGRQQMSQPMRLLPFVLYPLALIAFIDAALPEYSMLQRLLAWTLFVVGSWPIVRFARRPRGVPFLELVAAQYAVFFAFPVFHQERLKTAVGSVLPNAHAISITLIAALLALVSTIIGFRGSRRILAAALRPISIEVPDQRLFIFALASVAASHLISLDAASIPSAIERPLMLAISLDLGIAILAMLYHNGVLSTWRRFIALSALAASVILGLIGGMSQSALQPVLIWLLCGWITRRRAPVLGFAILAAAVILFQPIKGAYRQAVWYGEHTLTLPEKMELYGTLLYDRWVDAGGGPQRLASQAQKAASERLSLLLSSARYVEWTPSLVDYQNGSTVLYVAYGVIPRFVWPNKPIAQSANVQLPVEYGLQSARSVDHARFGVGHVAEVYVNFGLAGIVPVFLLFGALFRIPPTLLLRRQSVAATAILVALAVNMMYIGSTVGNVFGGFIQQILVQVLLLKLLVSLGRAKNNRGTEHVTHRGSRSAFVAPVT